MAVYILTRAKENEEKLKWLEEATKVQANYLAELEELVLMLFKAHDESASKELQQFAKESSNQELHAKIDADSNHPSSHDEM